MLSSCVPASASPPEWQHSTSGQHSHDSSVASAAVAGPVSALFCLAAFADPACLSGLFYLYCPCYLYFADFADSVAVVADACKVPDYTESHHLWGCYVTLLFKPR